jgi:hypothetical protein
MTAKERWTVYPLLLLAIGLALRGELVARPAGPDAGGRVSAETVVCRELVIVGAPTGSGGKAPIIVHAGRVKGGGGGRIEIRDADGVDAVAIGTSPRTRDGGVEFFDAEAKLLGRLGPKPTGLPESPAPAAE